MFGDQDLDAALPALNAALNALNQEAAPQPNAGLNAFNIGLIAAPFHGFGSPYAFLAHDNVNFVTGLNGPHEGVIGGPPVAASGTPLDTYFGRASDKKLKPPNWSQIQLPPIKKCLYQEHLKTAERSLSEVDAYRKANGITVGGRCVPKPLLSTDEVSLPQDLVEAVQKIQNSSLSRLQAQCWPVALNGRDLLATVKDEPEGATLGYLLPAIAHVRHQTPVKNGEGPIALVLAATRESARKIEQAFRDFAKHTDLQILCLSSGVPKGPQLMELKTGIEVCVATPIRLVAFMENKNVNLSRCSYLIVEGVDRMVAMGFEKQLRTIAENIRPDRQTLMWISSPSMDMDHLAEQLLTDHVTVTIGACQEGQDDRIEHLVLVFKDHKKEDTLSTLLQDILIKEGDQVIVFVDMKQTVDYLVDMLQDQGWRAVGIQRGKRDKQRNWALKAFRLRIMSILVTTDGAARDLELDCVCFVVNYDRPAAPKEYTRRVKHAAREDGTGRAYTFLAHSDSCHAKEMISILREAKQVVPHEVLDVAKKAPSKKSRAHDLFE